MFDYKPLGVTMRKHGESTQDIAELLNVPLEEIKDKLNNCRFISMSQLHRLCEHYKCGPECIMSWSSGGEVVKVNWSKIAMAGMPLTVLSIKCGLSRASFVNASKGSGKIKMDNARKIAGVLDCSVEDILE